MINIGFTGTKDGMTEEQINTVNSIFNDFGEANVVFHHGDCIGADADAHKLAVLCNFQIVIHPPINKKYRAYCDSENTIILPPRDYLVRNRHIVENSDLMIATPKGFERVRSGTWSTIRYAHKKQVPMTIVWPNGSVEERDSPNLPLLTF